MHTSVLLQEAVESMEVSNDGVYIDATYGVGGHSRLIADRGGKVLALDWDKAIVTQDHEDASSHGIELVEGNYAEIANLAKRHGFYPCDGILFDLGLSMRQIRESGRGFSYEQDDEPLDMRLNPELTTTAADIINTFSRDELYELLTRNAEEVSARPIISNIVGARTLKKIETVGDLKIALGNLNSTQIVARVFQALRIEVNHEYDNIRKGIRGAIETLAPGGKLVIIAFHPSEDRIIKRELLTYPEITLNKRAIQGSYLKRFERSAIMRIATKK